MRHTDVSYTLAEHDGCCLAAPELKEGDGANERDPCARSANNGVDDTNDERADRDSQGVEQGVTVQ